MDAELKAQAELAKLQAAQEQQDRDARALVRGTFKAAAVLNLALLAGIVYLIARRKK